MKVFRNKIDLTKTDKFFIFLFIFLFLFFHLINFKFRFHFSGDQAEASLKIFEIWKNKEITLVGPRTSLEHQGRHAFFSSIYYYFLLPFFLLANFDPFKANLLFIIFGSLSIIPFYIGTKKILKNASATNLLTSLFVLLPPFIDYTFFLWNPNVQIILSSIIIMLIGLENEKNRKLYLFLINFFTFLLLNLHYQFGIVAIIIATYYFFKSKKYISVLLGAIIGSLPFLLLEINTNFYNLKTFYLIFSSSNLDKINLPPISLHYVLPSLLFLILIILNYVKKYINPLICTIIISTLIIIDLIIYLPKQNNAWEMPSDWIYANEIKINQIISEQKLNNFNIINLAYVNPLSDVQKYLLAVKNPKLYKEISPDYYKNSYLYIVANNKDDLSQSINYEINTFKAKSEKKFEINQTYSLYLWER